MAAGRTHHYRVEVEWTGDSGTGTSGYSHYARSYVMRADGKPDIVGSSDPAFRGDASCWNPEDLLVASLSACHKLWYLHLCALAGVVVVAYRDSAEGIMTEDRERGGYFTEVTLRPLVSISRASDPRKAHALHAEAHRNCFIANSVTFPVRCEPSIEIWPSDVDHPGGGGT